MAAPTTGGGAPPPPSAPSRPTKYYFAYGSNIHLKQMKRRCPNSKYIGRARLADYRWHINERGYANVAEAEGHWVDGLVFEIDEADEARLDINEGVSKNAYSKMYMRVLLHRASSALYRRPTSWIVDKGGPAKVRFAAKPKPKPDSGSGAGAGSQKQTAENQKYWQRNVLVYASTTHITDSVPKEEYIKRINLAIADALALGVEDDYVRNCIRPFIPEPDGNGNNGSGSGNGSGKARNTSQGVPPELPPRTGEPSPTRKGQVPTGPDKQDSQPPFLTRLRDTAVALNKLRQAKEESTEVPPPLPPRPLYQFRDYPIIVVEEYPFIASRF
jgi:gamma-glutamylcyclotransferase (GGCT)/AIG2-like uncharacterized protein YtfP